VRKFLSHLGNWSIGSGPLHARLSRAIQSAIQRGLIMPGSRLPAERELAKALTVSRTTVVTAYTALRQAAWVESRRGSGTFACMRSLGANAIRRDGIDASSSAFDLLQNETSDVIDMTIGCAFPLTDLPKSLFRLPDDEHDALIMDRLYYPRGLLALREAIAEHYNGINLVTSARQILVTNGAQQALSLLGSLYLQRGDTVLIEDPTYYGAVDAFRAAGARLSSLPVGKEGVSPTILRERISSTAARLVYLTPTFQNPTGSVMPVLARKAIAKIATELGTPVIDDCCLSDVVLDGEVPPPLAFYGDPETLITVGGLSKLMWPGLRVGWIRAAENVIERLARVKTAFELGSSLLTQAIAVQLIAAIPEARRLRRIQLIPRRRALVDLLKKHLPDWKFRTPAGSFFHWVELSEGDAREFSQVALRHGVAIMPGNTMSAAGMQSRSVRLPYLSEPDTLRLGIERLRAAWITYRKAK